MPILERNYVHSNLGIALLKVTLRIVDYKQDKR